MIQPQKKLDELVHEMDRMANLLMPYHMPMVSKHVENDISLLKNRDAVVDGYNILLNYTKIKYFDKNRDFLYSINSLQVCSHYFPSLPFDLVQRVALKFFKNTENICFVVFNTPSKNFYGWFIVVAENGENLPPPNLENCEKCNFNGLVYYQFSADDVSFA